MLLAISQLLTEGSLLTTEPGEYRLMGFGWAAHEPVV